MSVQPFLIAAAGLFSIGIYGILVRRNVVMVLLSIELILNAVNINFVVFVSIILALMATIYPSYVASKINPAEVLKNE